MPEVYKAYLKQISSRKEAMATELTEVQECVKNIDEYAYL